MSPLYADTCFSTFVFFVSSSLPKSEQTEALWKLNNWWKTNLEIEKVSKPIKLI
jgi:hypothetical protein